MTSTFYSQGPQDLIGARELFAHRSRESSLEGVQVVDANAKGKPHTVPPSIHEDTASRS